MDVQPHNTILNDVSVEHAVAYLQATGWQQAVAPNSRWTVLHGTNDYEGRPFELVFPKEKGSAQSRLYIANAVNLVARLTQEEPERTITRMRCVERDVLRLRNVESGSSTHIPLTLASNQIFELKQLLAFGASAEYSRRPHFTQPLPIGVTLSADCRFAHTFHGSFGFTIESPVITQGIVYEYTKQRLSADFGPDEEIREAPFERRVMERIVRGLITTRNSVEMDIDEPLVSDYAAGFNANMCYAIMRMADEDKSLLEYDILWSPKYKPAADVANSGPIEISASAYPFLRSAYEKLGELQPTEVTVTGVVMALSSKDDPLRVSDADRAVVIHWRNRPGGRPAQLIVRLSQHDYTLAHEAHLKWKTISVRGIVSRVGKTWHLSEPVDFRVVD